MRDELVSGLPRERLEVLHRAGIGREHLEDLARLHVGQGLLGAQDGQRAVQSARIELFVEVHKVLCRMPNAVPEGAQNWLAIIAQLPVEDPASRMRVLRTLESLGAAVMREGAYLLPDSVDNRRALEALAEYATKSGGIVQVLHVSAASPAQSEGFRRLLGITKVL